MRLSREQARILTAIIDGGATLMFEPRARRAWLKDFLSWPDNYVELRTVRALIKKGCVRLQIGSEVPVTELGREAYRRYKERDSFASMESFDIWRDLKAAGER